MSRSIPQITAHIRAVAANPFISTTLVQTEDLLLLCNAAEALGHIAELGPAGQEQACDPVAASSEDDPQFALYDQGFCEAWRRAGDIARAAVSSTTTEKSHEHS